MIIIDKGEQLSLTDARIKEEQLRKEYNGNLNSKQAYVSVEESKDKIKEYNENNKEKKKDYREKNKENLKDYREKNKEKLKDYREKNKEKMKEYYENNKDIILAKWKEKVTCICGCILNKNNLSKHLKTPKHFNSLKMKNEITECENKNI